MKAISGDLLAWLAEPALRSLAVACVTALVIGLVRPRRSVTRLYTWVAVLYIALAMPLLRISLPRMKVAVPATAWIFSSSTSATAPPTAEPSASSLAATTVSDSLHAPNTQQHRNITASAQTETHRRPTTGLRPETAATPPMPLLTRVDWTVATVAIYLLGLGLLLARLLLGIRASHRLVREAGHICPRYFLRKDEVEEERTSAALDLLSSHSRAAGLNVPPRMKESAALRVPATVGIWKPVVLLPSGWHEWSQEKLEAVLAHEISHVARRDALTQLLSALHRAFFWFSPLPWWLDRQLTELAEQASDEAALAGGADRTLYAETLLAFFAQLESVPGRVRWHALSMASRNSSGHAERRVDRILSWKGVASMRKSLVAIFIVCAAPVIFLAASLRPFVAHARTSARLETAVQSQPAAPRLVDANSPAAVRIGDASLRASFATMGPHANSGEVAVQQAEKQSAATANTIHLNGNIRSGPRYVFMKTNSNDISMSGDDEDLQHARKLREKIKGDFIWFERDEKSYVITDPAFLARVTQLWAPQDELAKQQDELGRQQDELGRQQDALGAQQEKISVTVPDIRPELERIRLRLKELQSEGATQRELGSVQSQLGALQSRIGHLQSGAAVQQAGVARQQAELGRKQGALGRQQGELGRRQGELARQASRELRGMFDDAVNKGIAKPE